MCFEELRHLLPHIPPEEDEEAVRRPGEGNVGGQRSSVYDVDSPNKGVSKVALLRKSNEYLNRLQARMDRREGLLDLLREQIQYLRLRIPAHEGIDEYLADFDDIDWADLDRETEWPWGGVPGHELRAPALDEDG